jgi:tetratricopeptide (TPR) repeat protein
MRHLTLLVKPLRLAVTLCVCLTQTSFVAAQTKRTELTARQIAQRTFPSVVVLVAEDRSGDSYLGSGFFVDDDVVVTNYHVIKEATKVVARRVGQKHVYQTSIISHDAERDLALVRIVGAIARPLPLVKGIRIAVGDVVYVAGNPEGLEGTFSQGIVSALRGNEYVQITAPISHGSSGGPVLNSRGEVIGVAVGTIKEGQNLNFAISARYVVSLLAGAGGSNRPEVETNKTRRARVTRSGVEGPKYFCDQGDDLLSQGRHDEALEAFKQAVRIAPSFVRALVGLGRSYLFLNRYQEAAQAFEDALRNDTTHEEKDAYKDLADVYVLLDKPEAAILVGRRLVAALPNDEDSYEALAGIYDKTGRFETALETLKNGLEILPQSESLFGDLGLLYFGHGKYEEAIAELRRAVDAHPNFSSLYYFMGLAYTEMNRTKEAIEVLQQAVRLKPAYDGYHFDLGKAYLAIGDRPSAMREYQYLKRLGSIEAEWLFKEIYK